MISEAFITEQLRSYAEWEPIVVRREGAPDVGAFLDGRVVDVSRRVSSCVGAWPYRAAPAHVRAVRSARLIHAHFGPDGVYAQALARATGLPFVVTFHGYDATLTRWALLSSMQPSKIHYLLSRLRMARESAGLIAVSRFVARKLERIGMPSEKIHVHYIGVDTDKFSPPPVKVARDELRLLTVARLVESKAIDLAIRAVADLVASGIPCRYEIVGSGDERGSLENLGNRLGLHDVVKFTAAIPHEQIIAKMRESDIFLFPSRKCSSGAEEAFGIVLAEAAATGLPIVACNVGGIGEVVVNDHNGFLVEAGDVRGFGKAISILAAETPCRESFARNGRSLVLSEFNVETQTRRLERLYGGFASA